MMNAVDAYRPLRVIVPSQAPQNVGLVVAAVIDIAGLARTNGPKAGVMHAPAEEAMAAVIPVYVPAHRPVSVMEPVALLVTVSGA